MLVPRAGGELETVKKLFDKMMGDPNYGPECTPDAVTYTALISAYEKDGQWRQALEAYMIMCACKCPPDAILYNAIIDALWATGVIWAQRKVRWSPELARRYTEPTLRATGVIWAQHKVH